MPTTSYINQRIEDFLETEKVCNSKMLLQLTLYIYSIFSKESKNDLYILAKKLPVNYLADIVNYFSGDNIKMPTKEDFFTAYITANAFFLKEILQLEWREIKDILSLPSNEKENLSAISVGRKINTIKEQCSKDIYKILNNIDLDVKGIKITKKEIEKMFKKDEAK